VCRGELGQLEARHQDFAGRNTQIVAVSLDGPEETARTQEKFPHLIVLSDAGGSLAGAAAVIGPHHSPYGGETVSPTTVLIDRHGQVRWVGRPDRYIERFSPDEVLKEVDQHFRGGA
jgi:peroxiredoxin